MASHTARSAVPDSTTPIVACGPLASACARWPAMRSSPSTAPYAASTGSIRTAGVGTHPASWNSAPSVTASAQQLRLAPPTLQVTCRCVPEMTARPGWAARTAPTGSRHLRSRIVRPTSHSIASGTSWLSRERVSQAPNVARSATSACHRGPALTWLLRRSAATRALWSPLEPRPWLEFLPASCSCSGTFCPPCGSCSEVIAQPLRPGLAHVELRADRVDRRNVIRCQLIGEYLGCLLTQWVRVIRAAGYPIRYHLT